MCQPGAAAAAPTDNPESLMQQSTSAPVQEPVIMDALNGETVLITGGLGFLGSVALEQLLRLTSVKKVFLLVRGNRKGSASQRVTQCLQSPLFNMLHQQQPGAFSRVCAVEGDLCLPGLGLSAADTQALRDEVGIVLHCAASLDLEVDIHKTLRCNYLGTQALLQLASEMRQLRCFVHVSTFFVNNFLPKSSQVKEQIYPLPLVLGGKTYDSHSEFVNAVLALPADEANSQVAALMSHFNFTSTYAFGKHLTEQMLDSTCLGHGVAKAIVRPSLISGLAGAPYPGYISGYAGSPGFVMGYAVGFFEGLRSVAYSSAVRLDLIPCDTVAALVVAAGAAGAAGRAQPPAGSSCVIYHAASAESHPLPIATSFKHLDIFWRANPPPFSLPLTRFVTFPDDGQHEPTALGLAASRWITQLKIELVSRAMKLLSKGNKTQLLRNSFKAFCVQNDLPYGRGLSIICRVDNVRTLLASMTPAEQAAWPILWAKETAPDWGPYGYLFLAGVRHLLFKMPPGVNGVDCCYEPKQGATFEQVLQLQQAPPPAGEPAAVQGGGEQALAPVDEPSRLMTSCGEAARSRRRSTSAVRQLVNV